MTILTNKIKTVAKLMLQEYGASDDVKFESIMENKRNVLVSGKFFVQAKDLDVSHDFHAIVTPDGLPVYLFTGVFGKDYTQESVDLHWNNDVYNEADSRDAFPSLYAHDVRLSDIRLRVNKLEKARIKQMADDAGLTVSEFIRSKIGL